MNVRHLALVSALAIAAPVASLEARQQWGSRGLQQAYSEGYDRGLRAGDEDSRRGDSFNFTDEGDYRRADAGWRREYGNVEWYRTDFRRGYQEGYRAGFERFGAGRRQGPPPWSNGRGRGNGPFGAPGQQNGSGYGYGNGRYDLAASTGYTDGYDRGLDDGRDRRRNDPLAESRYRDGDHGYRSEYGPRDAYKLRYRDAFRQGYDQGYRDGARYNTQYNNRPWSPF